MATDVHRYLCKLRACAAEANARSGGDGAASESCKGCFSTPVSASPVARRAVLDAARVAGFTDAKVWFSCVSRGAIGYSIGHGRNCRRSKLLRASRHDCVTMHICFA